MDNRHPRKIGKYELIAKVAQGGMGTLYKARHPTLGRVVLLKKLEFRGGSGAVERFRREARLMMDFKNEHIVQVHDHFKEGGNYFIVEEFVDGISLDELIRRERYLSGEVATLILYEVATALRYAHDRGVVHRDIKPGNILISRRGEVKLADFGIATSRVEVEDGLTREGMMLGTPAYVAPEQIDDPRSVDRRSDIYSLGVVLYEMLTGRLPYPSSFTGETIRLIHKGHHAPIRRLNPGASPFLVKVARRCMRVRPSRRFSDLGQLVRILGRRLRRRDPESLRQAMQKVVEGKAIQELFKPRRPWAGRLVAAVVVAGILAGAGWYAWRQGWWYEYVAPGRYGALVLQASVDRSWKDPSQIYLDPVLYRDSGGTLEMVGGAGFVFHENPALSVGQDFVLQSDRLYLPTGRYRLKVSLEDQVYWFVFTVDSRVEQRRLLSTLDGQQIVVRQGSGTPLPLAVRWKAVDATTGRDVTGLATVAVWNGSAWMAIGADGPLITTGGTRRFRVTSPGYRPEEFSLLIKPYQTRLNLDVQLEPLASRGGATSMLERQGRHA
jgi:hypothetical protein